MRMKDIEAVEKRRTEEAGRAKVREKYHIDIQEVMWR
jgi:hypothetical protein